jgi:hypothetical protein
MAGQQRPSLSNSFPPLSSWVRAASPGRRAAVPHPLPAAADTTSPAGAPTLVAGVWGSVPVSPAVGPAWGAAPSATGWDPTAAGAASALAAVADVVPAGTADLEDPNPPPPIPPSMVVDPPPPPPITHQEYTVAALTAARAEHAARQARLREAALAGQREREAADAIAAQIAAAEQHLASPAAHDGGATSADTMGGVYGIPAVPTVGTGPRTIPAVLWHDPADPLVAQLHLQAGSVQNIRLMVSVVLESESPSYTRWRDLLLLTLSRYALDDHVLCDPTGVAPTAAWVRLDSIVLTWIVGTISVDLHSLLRNLPHARAAWLAIEGQFLGLPSMGSRNGNVVRGTLLKLGFNTTGTRLFPCSRNGTNVPGTRNVAKFPVPGY